MRGVDLEIDRLTVDAFVATCDPRRLILNLSLDVRKISEPSAGNVMELGPLRATSNSRRSIGVVEGIRRVLVLLDVDKLKDQRSSGADATPPGEEISADDIF